MPHQIAYTMNIVKKSDETTSFTKLINCLRDNRIMKKIVEDSPIYELNLSNNEFIELVNNSSLNFDIKKLEKVRKEDDERDERNRPLKLRKSSKYNAMQVVRDVIFANYDNVFALLDFLKKEKDVDSFYNLDDETTQMYKDALDKVINELESFINDRLTQKTVKFNMKEVSSHLETFYENMYQSDPDIHREIDKTDNVTKCFKEQVRELRKKIHKDELKECA